MTEIIPHLWLGDVTMASDLPFINHNIDLVINCSTDLPFFCENIRARPIQTYRLPINDDLLDESIEKMRSAFPEVTSLIYKTLYEKHQRVLVHCYAGIQRSAAVVAAYLMRYHEVPLSDVILLLKSKRIVAFTPQTNFYKALDTFQRDLYSGLV
jgi:protein-tyrosine phosphatase